MGTLGPRIPRPFVFVFVKFWIIFSMQREKTFAMYDDPVLFLHIYYLNSRVERKHSIYTIRMSTELKQSVLVMKMCCNFLVPWAFRRRFTWNRSYPLKTTESSSALRGRVAKRLGRVWILVKICGGIKRPSCFFCVDRRSETCFEVE